MIINFQSQNLLINTHATIFTNKFFYLTRLIKMLHIFYDLTKHIIIYTIHIHKNALFSYSLSEVSITVTIKNTEHFVWPEPAKKIMPPRYFSGRPLQLCKLFLHILNLKEHKIYFLTYSPPLYIHFLLLNQSLWSP